MTLPTLEDITEENRLYREHLDKGGKPIQIVLTLEPAEDSMNWHVDGVVPDNLPRLFWILAFTGYIKEQIITSVQAPNEIGQRN